MMISVSLVTTLLSGNVGCMAKEIATPLSTSLNAVSFFM